MSSLKRTTVYLTEKQTTLLDRLATNDGLKRSEHLRRAIDEYLLRKEVDKLEVSRNT